MPVNPTATRASLFLCIPSIGRLSETLNTLETKTVSSAEGILKRHSAIVTPGTPFTCLKECHSVWENNYLVSSEGDKEPPPMPP